LRVAAGEVDEPMIEETNEVSKEEQKQIEKVDYNLIV
jgi:hypothetical protein